MLITGTFMEGEREIQTYTLTNHQKHDFIIKGTRHIQKFFSITEIFLNIFFVKTKSKKLSVIAPKNLYC